MKKIKVLNLYAGIGGNRKLWENVEVTAIENNPEIAAIYQEFFPDDKVIVCDAHKYLLKNYEDFEFIWSSPPCPTHSKIRKITEHQNKPLYPNMKLYQEIIFLKHYFKGKWIVENVISYYDPLIQPQEMAYHYFWCNFYIGNYKVDNRGHDESIEQLQKIKGFDLSKYNGINKRLLLRNCVDPKVAAHIFKMAFKEKQEVLI